MPPQMARRSGAVIPVAMRNSARAVISSKVPARHLDSFCHGVERLKGFGVLAYDTVVLVIALRTG